MKTMKLALLGTAALAAVTVSARADDVAALKAQLEALNARVAQLEAAPAVPAGYQLLTVTEAAPMVIPGNQDDDPAYRNPIKTVTRIGILPTADAPASTVIEWSGFVRAALVYSSFDQDFDDDFNNNGVIDASGNLDNDDLDVLSRGQIQVVGKTDTAVGEVGVQMRVRGNFDGNGNAAAVIPDGTFGWWAMTPELTFSGGYMGTLGNIGYGYDGACTCEYTDNADVSLNPGDTTQLRLTYASGPLSMAVALEDATGTGPGYSGLGGAIDDELGAAAEFRYTGDTFNGELSAFWHSGAPGFNDAWAIGAGVGFALGDIANLSIGAQYGEYNTGNDFWRASALAGFNLTDAVRAELAYGFTSDTANGQEVHAFLAGLYYEPVSQLRLGLEAEYFINDGTFAVAGDFDADGTADDTRFLHDSDTLVIDFVTRWSF